MVAGQQSNDPRVADLVRSGRVRVALFLPQYTTDPVTGELCGGPVFNDIAHALADRIGVEVYLTGYQNPREVVKCLKGGKSDLAFMVPDNSRNDDVGFSPPVLRSDFTCLVPAGSSIGNIADADRPGVRIAAVRNHVSTLTLSRILKQAELITAETPDATFALLRNGHCNAMASARSVLLDYSTKLPDSRVLDDCYGGQLLAMAVPRAQAGWLAYVSDFVEEAIASGLVQRAIDRAGRAGLQAGTVENPNNGKPSRGTMRTKISGQTDVSMLLQNDRVRVAEMLCPTRFGTRDK
jgi:polar amino acid transport system substrate-binding protein